MEYFDYDQTDWERNFPLDFDVDEFLEESQEQEQDRLESELERINELLEEREAIHREAVGELESKLEWYIERLEKSYQIGVKEDKMSLKQRIEEFYCELRELERKHWLDRQDLENDRRRVQKEIDESMLDDLIDLF